MTRMALTKVADPLADPLARLQQALTEAPVHVLPVLIGELEKLKAQALSELSRRSTDITTHTRAIHEASRRPSIDRESNAEYLSIRELTHRIGYAEGTIRNLMSRGIFKLNEHYVKPRGRIFFKWPAVRRWLETSPSPG